jgi:hypothetical protein
VEYAREAAKNISEGFTIYGKPGVWYENYAEHFGNASCRDPFNELVCQKRPNIEAKET